MAEDKKGFLLYADYQDIFKSLTDKQAGQLAKVIFSYVNDENPEVSDQILKIAFEPIKKQLKRDLVKYQKTKTARSEAGRASAEKKKQQNSTKLSDVEQSSTKSTDNVNDNVSVTDNVNDTVTDNDIKGAPSQKKFDLIYPFTSEEFITAWGVWVEFRAEIKKPYQTFSEQQAALQFLSKYPELTAIEIIYQSIRNKWKDFFSLKDNGNTKKGTSAGNDNRTSIRALVDELRKGGQSDQSLDSTGSGY